MAALFGNGATYDSMEGRFRQYRRDAETLKKEAEQKGIDLGGSGRSGRSNGATPRTPRSGRGAILKSTSKKGSGSNGFIKSIFGGTPTKGKKSLSTTGTSVQNAISLDEDEDEDMEDIDIIDMIKGDPDDVFYDTIARKPKIETRARATPLFNIQKETGLVDSQTNGYVAPTLSRSPSSAKSLSNTRKDSAPVDSQSNVHVASTLPSGPSHTPVPYRRPQVQDAPDDENASEYEDAYEYDDMA